MCLSESRNQLPVPDLRSANLKDFASHIPVLYREVPFILNICARGVPFILNIFVRQVWLVPVKS